MLSISVIVWGAVARYAGPLNTFCNTEILDLAFKDTYFSSKRCLQCRFECHLIVHIGSEVSLEAELD